MAACRRLLFFGMEGVERTNRARSCGPSIHLRPARNISSSSQQVEALPSDFGSDLFNFGPGGLVFLGLCPRSALFLSLE